jgi:hypothetical protein
MDQDNKDLSKILIGKTMTVEHNEKMAKKNYLCKLVRDGK